MGYTKADLEQAQRHVSHGESMVRHQQLIVDGDSLGQPERSAAEAWLEVFRAGLAKHVAERDKIVKDLAARFP
jgi:hypothetical protein